MTVIPKRLTEHERAAVRYLLQHSALADCVGTEGRVILDGHDLTLQRLDTWTFSSGELVLLDVLKFAIGEAVRLPDLDRLDEDNQRVCAEAFRLLVPNGATA